MSNQDEYESDDNLDIAIIGMAGRFPGAKNVDQFWDNLKDGLESITFFTDEELMESGVLPAQLQDPKFVRAGALLKDIDFFDASFFGLSPREAEILDPQQRLLLEGAWEALENAGYDPERYKGLIGVYAGVGLNTYMLNLLRDPKSLESTDSLQVALANDKDYLATRISYKLNLKGPSVSVQTACSTSLVAIHIACQSLLNYDSDIAIAGGVSVRVPHRGGYLYQEGSILSSDGHCRAFDEKSNGTIFGNGMGVVVLKRLKDALEDGDCIHAVIKGSAINNDGSLKVGFTAPSVEGQAKVIEDALQVAGISKESISYIETHGTGTTLGDPIEIDALNEVYGHQIKVPGSIKIGSVKTNIGHLDTAAGVSSLIKTVMALKNKQIPATLNFENPNRQINFDSTPFVVNDRLSEWESQKGIRRAGVSSFGMGGTNSHVILEEAPEFISESSKRPYQLLMLSAKTEEALEDMTYNMSSYLKENPNLNLADVAFTTQVGRRLFDHRRLVIGHDCVHAAHMLENLDTGHVMTGYQEKKARPVAFMFTGQGAQYVNMAKELYENETEFRVQVDFCSKYLKKHLDFDLREILYPAAGQEEEATRQLMETEVTQPALFVIEYALAKLWQEWGVTPEAMIGHSVGEYVAACLAGVFSLEDGLHLVAARGKLMQSLEKGEMLAIGLPEAQVVALLEDTGLDIAAINGPSLCVVSGPVDKVKAFGVCLTANGQEYTHLHTSHAFHSSMMEPILEEFTKHVRNIKLHKPTLPYISNLTGTWITAEQAISPEYYASHLRSAVRFSQGVQTLQQAKDYVVLEVGPGDTLTKIAKQSTDHTSLVISSLRPPTAKVSDYEYLLKAVGFLWVAGIEFNWKNFYVHEKRFRVPLPTYPFQRKSYWIEVNQYDEYVKVEKGKKANIKDWFYLPVWKRSLPLKNTGDVELKQFLLFGTGDGVSYMLAERLKSVGHKVVTVTEGEQFVRIDEHHYVINPEVKDQYFQLIKDLSNREEFPHSVLHLWSLTDKQEERTSGFDVDQNRYFNTLLYLAQAIGDVSITEKIQISVLTNGLFDITGAEQHLNPEKALLMGPAKVIHQEYRNLSCRVLDVDFPVDMNAAHTKNLIDKIVDECTLQTKELLVAYRGTHRWLQTFEPKQLDGTEGQLPVREGGTYLITGGLGGLGLLFANYLAVKAQARLVLVGRNGLPKRETWADLLSRPDTEARLAEKIQAVQKLEQLGSEVLVIAADVTDHVSMQGMIDQVQLRFGKLNGVLHAAGVPGGGLLQLKTPITAGRVMAPKVKGTLVLSDVLDLKDLDFFVLFSTTLSTTGGLGQVDYTAANAFIDAFAHKSHASGLPVMAIDWDAWKSDTWQEASFEAQPELQAQVKELRAKYAISDEEGVQAMDIALRTLLPQIVVSTKEFSTTIFKHAFYTEIALDNESSTRRTYSRQLNERSYVAPSNEVEEIVAKIWQEILGIEKVGVKDHFIDLGGHSLLAAQMISRLREYFQIDLPMQELFDRPTVEEMSELIFELVLGQVEDLSEEEIQTVLQSEGSEL